MGRTPHVPPELTLRPFSLDEARAAGVTLSALRGKSWERVGSKLYRWIKIESDTLRLLAAWRQTLPPGAAFAGLTAAWLHRLDVDPSRPIEIVVPPDSPARSRTGLAVWHSTVESTIVRGLPATTLERTFRDLRRRLAQVELLVLADQALRLGLGRFHDRAAPAESPMETRLRWLLIQARLPAPEVQADLRDSDGRFLGRADMYYAPVNLVIEFDGSNHRDRLVSDNRRQNALVGAGYRVLRFTGADLSTRADAVVAQVRSALASMPR